MKIDESDEQRENAEMPMQESTEPGSNVTVASDWQPRKQSKGISGTEEGMQIDARDEHSQNAEGSIQESSEPDSSVTVVREWQSLKQLSQILATEEGMQIDESDEHSQNAISPIHETTDWDSKVTLRTVTDRQKQPTASVLMVFGMITSAACPKYPWIEAPTESIRKCPSTTKVSFASETEISCMFVPTKASRPISRSAGGMKSDESDEHSENAKGPIDES
jgi:hypothetical protein